MRFWAAARWAAVRRGSASDVIGSVPSGSVAGGGAPVFDDDEPPPGAGRGRGASVGGGVVTEGGVVTAGGGGVVVRGVVAGVRFAGLAGGLGATTFVFAGRELSSRFLSAASAARA